MSETKNEKTERKTTDDGQPVVETIGRDFRVEGNDVSGYIGVSPEYRNYANETDRPYVTDEDVALLEKSGIPTDVELLTLNKAEQVRKAEAKADAEAGDDKSDEDKSDEDKKSDDKSDEDKKTPAKAAPAKAAATPAKSGS